MPNDADHAAATTPAPSTPQAPVASIPYIVDQDCTCAKCSYNLRGLPATGNCPECGLSLSSSLPGTMNSASSKYLSKLKLGLLLMLMSPIFPAFGLLIAVSLVIESEGWSFLIPILAGIVFANITLIPGVFFYTSPDSARPEPTPDERNRWLLRIILCFHAAAVLAAGACIAVYLLVPALSIPPFDMLGPVVLFNAPCAVTMIVGLVVTLKHSAWIARRLGDERTARALRRGTWALPLISILLIPVGPLIAITAFVVLHDRILKNIRTIQ